MEHAIIQLVDQLLISFEENKFVDFKDKFIGIFIDF